jgi:hypothetical protein
MSEEFARWFCRKVPGDPLKWIDEQVERERHAKLPLLLKHYGIAGQTDRDFKELAKLLAVDFIDGFKLAELAPKPVGAPGRWTGAEGAQLVDEVEALMGAHNLNVADAIRLIRKIAPIRYGNMKEPSLRKRYGEAKKRFCR